MRMLVEQLAGGHLNLLTIIVWTLCAFVVALAGGALVGIRIGGKDLGNELAALMGAMFGPTAVPGIVLGLVVLAML